MKRTEGKVIIVTGGALGIGRETCILLAKEGAKVALCSRSHEKLVEAEAALKEEFGAETSVASFVCDVTDKDQIDQLIADVSAHFGGLDILINNAGTGSEETILDASDDRWQYYCTHSTTCRKQAYKTWLANPQKPRRLTPL